MRIGAADLLLPLGFAGLFFLWILLGLLGGFRVLPKGIQDMYFALPSWFTAASLFFAPVFAGLTMARTGLRHAYRSIFGILLLISVSTFGLCYRRYGLVTLLVIGLLYVEVLWLIPAWNKRCRK